MISEQLSMRHIFTVMLVLGLGLDTNGLININDIYTPMHLFRCSVAQMWFTSKVIKDIRRKSHPTALGKMQHIPPQSAVNDSSLNWLNEAVGNVQHQGIVMVLMSFWPTGC